MARRPIAARSFSLCGYVVVVENKGQNSKRNEIFFSFSISLGWPRMCKSRITLRAKSV